MSTIEKKILRFLHNPTSVRFLDIVTILTYIGFEHIHTKGSHQKFKHPALSADIVVPVHNNECKDFYKIHISKIVKKLYKPS